MPKIICTIPGCPPEVGGPNGTVKFEPRDEAMVSEEVSDEVATYFGSIPGYAVEGAAAPAVDPDKAEFDALLARAAAVNLAVDKRWKLPRLRAEVEHAEEEAAGGSDQ